MTDYSQNGESKILHELFNKIGIDKGYFIDYGAGDGFHLSNTQYFKQLGWDGEMFDAKNSGEVKNLFITLDNCKDAFENKKVNLFSLDIDGNDYHILNEVLSDHKPDVICFEINSQLPLDKCMFIQYDATRFWDGSNAFGMSYKAGFKLCEIHGYDVYAVVNNTNIIAVKKEFKVAPLEYKYGSTWSHPDKECIWVEC